MQFEDDPFYLNFKNFTTSMVVGDSKHIEVNDNHSLFVIKVGSDQFTGWYYWDMGNIVAETFTNASLTRIVELGYETGVLKTSTPGEIYNDYMANELQKEVAVVSQTVDDVGIEKPTETQSDRSDRPTLGVNTIIKPRAVWIDEINGDEIKITIKKSEENNMNDDKTVKLATSPFGVEEYKVVPTVDDFYNGKVNTQLDETVVKYRELEQKTTEQLTKLENTKQEEQTPAPKNEDSRSTQEILTDVWRAGRFLDKEDKAF